MAVFYRTNAQSRVLEEYLMRVGVPYKVIGGTRFYDRKEIKDAMAYLKAVVNPIDEVSLKRTLNTPRRGVGDGSVAKMDNFSLLHGLPFIEALKSAPEAGVTGKAVRGIERYLQILDDTRDMLDKGPATVLEHLLDVTGYRAELEADRSVEADGRLENLGELLGVAAGFETVDEFLEQVALVADTDQLDEEEPAVFLMTMHSAKGLEFPVVFVMGLEDGIFPHIRSIGEPEELEEERRLAYVGITRAEQRLYLTNAWSRNIYGTTQYNPPSRFLDEIPEELITHAEGSRTTRRGASGSSRRGGSGAGSLDLGRPKWSSSREERIERALAARQSNPLLGSGTGSDGSAETVPEPLFRVGDDVQHAKWGEGVILDVEGHGEKAEATVRFPSVGEKKLLLSWAPLEKL